VFHSQKHPNNVKLYISSEFLATTVIVDVPRNSVNERLRT
jgi:hypothetical protein